MTRGGNRNRASSDRPADKGSRCALRHRGDDRCSDAEIRDVFFDNHEAPMFNQPEPAARAWELTREFLARTLPA